MGVIEGSLHGYTTDGAPVAGTAEVQTITIGGTPESGSTFDLKFGPFKVTGVAWNATNATLVAAIDAALESLPGIGTGGVVTAVGTATAGVGTFTVTFATKRVVPTIVADNFLKSDGTASAGTIACAETTPGVDPSPYGAAKGATVTDTTNGKLYINTGTALAPTWTVVGAQS